MTAYFCAWRRPGTVLRVSSSRAPVWATRSAYRRAVVAVPDLLGAQELGALMRVAGGQLQAPDDEAALR